MTPKENNAIRTNAIPAIITRICLLATRNASCVPKHADSRTLGSFITETSGWTSTFLQKLGETRKLVPALACSYAGGADCRRGPRECRDNAIHEESRPIDLRDALMHHGAVAIPFDLRLESLARRVPIRDKRPAIARQTLHDPPRRLGTRQVQESVSHVAEIPKLHRDMHEVIAALEASESIIVTTSCRAQPAGMLRRMSVVHSTDESSHAFVAAGSTCIPLAPLDAEPCARRRGPWRRPL